LQSIGYPPLWSLPRDRALDAPGLFRKTHAVLGLRCVTGQGRVGPGVLDMPRDLSNHSPPKDEHLPFRNVSGELFCTVLAPARTSPASGMMDSGAVCKQNSQSLKTLRRSGVWLQAGLHAARRLHFLGMCSSQPIMLTRNRIRRCYSTGATAPRHNK
jgi:hypothetical protein